MIGSSLFEEEFHRHFFDNEHFHEGQVNVFILKGEQYKVNIGNDDEAKVNGYIVPKCITKNSFISKNDALNYIQKNIHNISLGDIFNQICRYVKESTEFDDLIKDFNFIIVLTGLYFSKRVK